MKVLTNKKYLKRLEKIKLLAEKQAFKQIKTLSKELLKLTGKEKRIENKIKEIAPRHSIYLGVTNDFIKLVEHEAKRQNYEVEYPCILAEKILEKRGFEILVYTKFEGHLPYWACPISAIVEAIRKDKKNDT